VGELDGGRPRLTGGDDPVHEAEGQCLLRADRPAREDEVHRPAVADEPREPHRPTVDERDTPPPAEHPEDRALVGHPQVAPERELEAPGHRIPVDRGDDRLGETHAGRAHRPVAVWADAVRALGADRLEVGARAERRPVAGEYGHGRVGLLELPERAGQLGRHRSVDGIAPVRPRQHDDHHRAVALDPDVLLR